MAQLFLGAWERNDLLRILDYAKEKKIQDFENGIIKEKDFEMDIMKIDVLKCRALGIKHTRSYIVNRNIDNRM